MSVQRSGGKLEIRQDDTWGNQPPADSILITREQLKRVEWFQLVGQFDILYFICPECKSQSTIGHTETCWLGAALNELRGKL